MTDLVQQAAAPRSDRHGAAFEARLRRRHAAERRFRLAGLAAVAVAASILVLLLGSIAGKGWTAFQQTRIELEIHFDAAEIDPQGTRDPAVLAQANTMKLIRDALAARFPEATGRAERRQLSDLLSSGAPFELNRMLVADPSLVGRRQTVWLTASANVDQFVKGHIPRDVPAAERKVNDLQIRAIDTLTAGGALTKAFNTTLFTAGDSRYPEQAGIGGAIVGSLLTLVVCLGLSVPIGVAAAVYLEEFAPKNRWTDLIEVNINNLAAVPSIIFGLLGLAVFLNVFGMPRSAPLVGGFVLALMTLPVIIIASRVAMKAVPPSIREAALGIGASRLQVVLHHVLPLAMPGILTGIIIGTARALGETAPLLMIGMIAFIVDIPQGFTDSATVLPVQIFMWADSPERAFVERTSAAILVLLGFLILMNGLAVFLRKKFERRW
ncbi:phosphate ABC transporter permease PstA [Azospirillum sp.]|uniref:phosphate ABC transporter permease PstA n=1 Tax=Azospirillum sp. TaxID=34012 RepID=UPI002D34BA55|nr:phosphate ABC transporter permease PstA [Azospirillum sp.]HYD66325.1 phosphate ABC transporter permease PstA [Azospirillum sp.]